MGNEVHCGFLLLVTPRCVNSVAINADGHCGVSVSDDRTLNVWDLDTGEVIAFFRGEARMRTCGIREMDITSSPETMQELSIS
jgi:WD40 repeat protein